MMASIAGAAGVTAVVFFFGVRDLLPLVFVLTSTFALFMSIRAAVVMARIDLLTTGGPLAHIGLAILLLGIIGSGFYSEQKTVSLPIGQEVEVMGYRLTYVAARQIPDNKIELSVKARHGETEFETVPVMFHSDYNNSVMRNPDYVSFLTKDFYLEPVSLEVEQRLSEGVKTNVVKGQSVLIAGYTVTFDRFEMQPHDAASTPEGSMTIGAKLTVTKGKQTRSLTPISVFAQGQVQRATGVSLEEGMELRLMGMNIDMTGAGSSITVEAATPGAVTSVKPETLVAEVSIKPFISLVWFGTIVCFAGVALATVRRRLEGSPATVEARSPRTREAVTAA